MKLDGASSNLGEMKLSAKLRILSGILGLLSMMAIIYVDIQIANVYSQADGKTRALGLFELRYMYKYCILIPALVSVLLTLWIFRLKQFSLLDGVILLLSLTAIVATLTSSWRLVSL